MGLPEPDIYVPPAWALGALTAADLAGLPFLWYESLTGFLAPALGARLVLPLVGFEADTLGRQIGLEAWNRSSVLVARLTGRPVRISIHPNDLHLRLGARLREVVEGGRFRFHATGTWLEDQAIGWSASKTTPVASPSTQRT
jgi:hypothetical protein